MVEFDDPGPFVVRSQDAAHPFYFAGHMTSCDALEDNTEQMGDPETVGLVPPEQFLSRYVFFTDPT
jgi:IgGFc binding protein